MNATLNSIPAGFLVTATGTKVPVGPSDSPSGIVALLKKAGVAISTTSLRRLFADTKTARCGVAFEEGIVDGFSPFPQTPIKKGSKNDQIFKMLCKRGGVTVAEIAEETGWTTGGVCSVVYSHTKHMGYDLVKNRVAGRGVVIQLALKGVPVKVSEILYK